MTSASGVVQLHEKLVSHTVRFQLIEISPKNAHWEFLQTLQECKPADATMLVNLQPEVHVRINKLLFC